MRWRGLLRPKLCECALKCFRSVRSLSWGHVSQASERGENEVLTTHLLAASRALPTVLSLGALLAPSHPLRVLWNLQGVRNHVSSRAGAERRGRPARGLWGAVVRLPKPPTAAARMRAASWLRGGKRGEDPATCASGLTFSGVFHVDILRAPKCVRHTFLSMQNCLNLTLKRIVKRPKMFETLLEAETSHSAPTRLPSFFLFFKNV